MYYVNLYQTTKCYGGPEEGGWYYEEGVYHSCEGAYSNKDEAWAKARRVQPKLKPTSEREHMGYGPHDGAAPEGNGDDRYLLRGGAWGRGKFAIKVQEHPGENYPQQRPYYE